MRKIRIINKDRQRDKKTDGNSSTPVLTLIQNI